MKHKALTAGEALSLAGKVDPKYRSVWDGRPAEDQAALAKYFLPHDSGKPHLTPTRPRIIKWYCPFAPQSEFPSGHRYCINVYTGCAHQCAYCYAASYAPENPACKKRFEELIQRDMEDLEEFDVPAAPVHLSNSTDPFQPLEAINRHTRCALEQILAHRHRFTTVTMITKNPMLAARDGYLDLFRKLMEVPTNHPRLERFRQAGGPYFCVEVSLAFWQEAARKTYDQGAPTIESRKEGIRAIRNGGIPVVLRIDPLFPRSPLREDKTLADFGLPEAQTIGDLESLVAFAREAGIRHVVYSPAKIVQPRGRKLFEVMRAMRSAYECVAWPERLRFHAGSWRLPPDVAKARVTQPFLDICSRLQVRAKHCMQNLIETP
jgi:DNA repair photolyase